MAVVFISPKKQQQTVFVVVGIGALLIIGFILLLIFAWSPSSGSVSATFNKPKVVVNFAILENPEVQNLSYFETIPLQFAYTAQNTSGKTVTGFISSDSEADARTTLTQSGLQVGKIAQVLPGRENPFVSY